MKTTGRSGLGVEGEHHATRPEVAAHHALDAGGQGDLLMRIAFVRAVGNGAVVVKRGKYLLHRGVEGVEATHVEESLLLAREGSVR